MCNKYDKYGIHVFSGERESYIYLCGIKPVRPVRLAENIILIPNTSSPKPNDMIDCVMKNGSGDEMELGLLIATLRRTTAILKIKAKNEKQLAIDTWNAQTIGVLIGALLNCEVSWYFQANVSADNFTATTRISQVYPNMYKFPSAIKTLNESKCLYLEKNILTALNLNEDKRFSNASNALWSYRWNPRPAVQLSVIWGGIESLFLIERGIKRNLSIAASRFITGGDDMVDEIRELYEARCKAVHELENSTKNLLNSSAELLYKLITKCVEQNSIPDINSLLN